MDTEQSHAVTPPAPRLSVAAATVDDIRQALTAGLRDLAARPGLSLFFGVVYAALGALLVAGLAVFNQIWITIAVAIGFPLVAPFLAAGLYEMSRRLQRGEPFAASDIFLVIFRQQRSEFAWMSLVMLFVFWIWAYQVRLILALTLQYKSFGSLEQLLSIIVSTSEGATFLAVGSVVGAVLATILFSIAVISMPLLLDRQVDVITAMITSVKTVLASPAVMLGWGAVIGALTLLSVATAFIGVIVVFPVLGHATWHLYTRLVSER